MQRISTRGCPVSSFFCSCDSSSLSSSYESHAVCFYESRSIDKEEADSIIHDSCLLHHSDSICARRHLLPFLQMEIHKQILHFADRLVLFASCIAQYSIFDAIEAKLERSVCKPLRTQLIKETSTAEIGIRPSKTTTRTRRRRRRSRVPSNEGSQSYRLHRDCFASTLLLL
jgi:hypothetical protein